MTQIQIAAEAKQRIPNLLGLEPPPEVVIPAAPKIGKIGDAAVVSSSPERFLKVHRDGWVEAFGATNQIIAPTQNAAADGQVRTVARKAFNQ